MGLINVYTGPMKCGKSKSIIEEAKKQVIAGKNVKIFKPIIDNRFNTSSISDRNGNMLPAINIENIEDLKKYNADVYIIDEFQFLKGEIKTIQELVSKGKKFYIAGLNLTAEKKPFGKMGELLCVSDNINIMKSICECCHNEEAIYSYCKVDKKEDILVGDNEYISVCNNCYNNLTNGINNNIYEESLK